MSEGLVESIDNALRLITLVRHRGSIRVSEAAVELGIAASTSHRLLSTLRYRGFVVQRADKAYVVGPALAEGSAPPRSRPIEEVAQRHLTWLRDNSEETAHLMVRDGWMVRVLASVESAQPLRVTSRAGVMLPAHLTSGGRALLAHLTPDDFALHYPDEGVALLGLGPHDVRRLKAELDAVHARGHGINPGEAERGVAAVGAAVRDPDGVWVAAISATMPTVRFQGPRLQRVAYLVVRAAHAIERDLISQTKSSA